MESKDLTSRCCIVGGGPAGIMLGYLLARAGIETIVLEKWPDFFRDFRGDTIHPSTMEILYELGLLEEFLTLPHNQTYQIEAAIDNHNLMIADFTHLKVHCPFIAFIPQWDFLNFMVKCAQKYSHFKLLLHTEVIDLIKDDNKIIGVRAKDQDKTFNIYADLVVGADGRHSIVRKQSGLLEEEHFGAPMDVLWFRISRQSTDPKQSLGRIALGKILIMLERGSYWQCGFLIRKGDLEKVKSNGIEAFRQSIVIAAPVLADRIHEIQSWEEIKLLEVRVDRLKTWYRSGLLCIGDAAHAMSPIGGVGINLAIQDAVASANFLIPSFAQNNINEEVLAKIQKRRLLPTRIIQRIQVYLQNKIIERVLNQTAKLKIPFLLKLLQYFPYLQRIPAYIIGIGFRPEHVKKFMPPQERDLN